jgi:hypothetical protein
MTQRNKSNAENPLPTCNEAMQVEHIARVADERWLQANHSLAKNMTQRRSQLAFSADGYDGNAEIDESLWNRE